MCFLPPCVTSVCTWIDGYESNGVMGASHPKLYSRIKQHLYFPHVQVAVAIIESNGQKIDKSCSRNKLTKRQCCKQVKTIARSLQLITRVSAAQRLACFDGAVYRPLLGSFAVSMNSYFLSFSMNGPFHTNIQFLLSCNKMVMILSLPPRCQIFT